MGILSKKLLTEAERKLAEIESQAAEEEVLAELRRREREEEERRIYHSIIEDRIRDQITA